ncbi:MAG: methionyl-tRNA formyltransferase [Ferruginibacter sp.]
MDIRKEDLKIIFMGTPEFAVASLDAILLAGYNVIAVVTAPDKHAGRGMELQQSEVKKYADEKGIKTLQPVKLKDPEFIEALAALNANLQVVVAFRMLPEIVWNMPEYGTINLHGSLLPDYRGAAPINWAIINGEKVTGVTTFKLQHEIDTGNILLQEKITILENDTAGSLHDKMKITGGQLLVKTLASFCSGPITEHKQDALIKSTSVLHHAPKLFTAYGEITWDNPCEDVYNKIRGLSPHPAAYTTLHGKKLKIFSAAKEIIIHKLSPGTLETDGKTFMKFACPDGFIVLEELQLEGKRKLAVKPFLTGYRHS